MTDGTKASSSGGGGVERNNDSNDGCPRTPINHRGRRWRKCVYAISNWCKFLCVTVYHIAGCLLCLLSLKPQTRAFLVFLYCLLGGWLGQVLLVQHYRDQDIPSSPGDLREVTGISPVFCQKLSIISTERMETYMFENRKPEVNTLALQNYEYEFTSAIPNDNYKYWGYYLLEGSIMNYSICPDNAGIKAYIIKSKTNLNKWLYNSYCDDCYTESHLVEACNDPDNPPRGYVSVKDSDDYYILLVARPKYLVPPISTTVQFKLQRTRYDLQPSRHVCYMEMSCIIPLNKTSKYFVFDVPAYYSENVDVTIMCGERVYVYVLIFQLVPAMVGLFIAVLILKHARKQQRKRQARANSHVVSGGDQVSGALMNGLPSTYGSVN